MKSSFIRKMCVCAVLSALSVVLAVLAKQFFPSGPYRLTFENTPIFIASFSFGPSMGIFVALVADLISCLISGMSPIPLVTVGSVVIALFSGLFFRLLRKTKNSIKLFLSIFIGHLFGSIIIKSIGLYPFFGNSVYFRIPIYCLTVFLEFLIIFFLFKRKSMKKIIISAGGTVFL